MRYWTISWTTMLQGVNIKHDKICDNVDRIIYRKENFTRLFFVVCIHDLYDPTVNFYKEREMMPNVVGVNEGRFTLIMATSSYVTLELFFYRCHMSGATQRRPQPNLRMGTNCYICKTSTGRKSKLREREGLRYVDVVQSVISFMLIWSDTHSMLIRFTYQNIYELSNKTWRSTLMNHQQNP